MSAAAKVRKCSSRTPSRPSHDSACDFGEVFTTDGRITALNLELVEDANQAMTPYNVSYVLQNEVYQANAETYAEVVNAILAPLTEQKMQERNAQVDVEGEPADTVAEDYVSEIGLG